MNKRKIINDPIYGLITLPFDIIFDILEHPYVQRLRHIQQLGLTHYVYPGAQHTRFHHALGAMHLMTEAIAILRSKGTLISEQEAEAVTIAVLLHDLGHGPFSHALEHTLLPINHEELSILLMKELNRTFDGKLDVGIAIFCNNYPRRFFHQLVSGQLDMDRMDYLNRDSYYTGVHEGVIGYDRIIKMLAVKNDELVVEEKGIFSIEKFLVARRLMYWQVYLHKTVVCAEQMLIHALLRAKELTKKGVKLKNPKNLDQLLQVGTKIDIHKQVSEFLPYFVALDDAEVWYAIKEWQECGDTVLELLAKSLVHRKLFKVEIQNFSFKSDFVSSLRHKVANQLKIKETQTEHIVFVATETNRTYHKGKDEIKILYKDGRVEPLSKSEDYHLRMANTAKFFLCYPKENQI